MRTHRKSHSRLEGMVSIIRLIDRDRTAKLVYCMPIMLPVLPIGAGNACVLKLSEIAVATSNLLAELIPSYLDKVKDVHTVCMIV